MTLQAEIDTHWAKINRLVAAGRLGAARRAVDGLCDVASPAVVVVVRNRFDALAPQYADGVGVAWFPVETAAPTDGLSGALVRVSVQIGKGADLQVIGRTPGWRDALHAGLRAAGVDAAVVPLVVRFDPLIEGQQRLHVEGRSAELALAVAACSAARDVAPPQRTAYTGAVEPDGTLTAPEAMSQSPKLQCVREEWHGAGRLVSGAAAIPEVGRHATLAALLAAEMSRDLVVARPKIAELFTRLGPLERDGRYDEAMRVAESLWDARARLSEPSHAFQVALEGLRLANHKAVPLSLATWRARAEAALETADPRQRGFYEANLAIAAIDRGDVEQAVGALEATEAALPARAAPDFDRVQVLGTLARALSACGQHGRAIAVGDRAAALAPWSERPRNQTDAALWRLRAGRPADALALLDATESLLEDVAADFDVEMTRGFRALVRTRALLALGRTGEAEKAREGILRPGRGNHALTLGHAETGVALGKPLGQQLDGLDFERPGALARLRARIEYARADGDLVAAERWAGGFTPEMLAVRVPY